MLGREISCRCKTKSCFWAYSCGIDIDDVCCFSPFFAFQEPKETSQDGSQPGDQSPSISQTENDMSARESLSPTEGGSKRVSDSRSSNVKVILNTLDATRHWKISEDGLTIRNDGSTFESIRATKSVTCGKWFYEVTLTTAGIMQLGWATAHGQFSPEDGTGVGDDLVSLSGLACTLVAEERRWNVL